MTPSLVTLKTVGNWYQEMEIPLAAALSASTEMCGKTGYKACEQAIVYMAKAASVDTKKSKEFREIVENPFLKNSQGKRMRRAASAAKWGYYTYENGRKVFNPLLSVENAPWIVYFNSATTGEPLVKNMRTGKVHRDTRASKGGIELSKGALKNDRRLRIKNSGLAKKSWMWGLKGFTGKSIRGVTDVRDVIGATGCGLVLTDRLSYINKAIPPNLVERVTQKATNSIMFQVAKKIEKDFSTEIPAAASRRKQGVIAKLEVEFQRQSKRSTMI